MRPLRFAIIGAGSVAVNRHIPVLLRRQDVIVDSVCRPGRDTLTMIRDHFGIAFASEDYREVLARDLDVAIVSSPHDLHYLHVKAALERGLHVLCEKPMTLDPADAWDLVRIARERARHLVVSNGWNYSPPIAAARQLMVDGAVGDIQFVICNMASRSYTTFVGTQGMAKHRTTLVRPDISTWQDPKRGGGYAYGQISHSAALMFWVTGLRAWRVQCVMAAPGATVDLYDAAIVRFRNGAIGSVTGNAALPDDCPFQIDLQIAGSEGTMNLILKQAVLEVLRYDGKHHRVAIDPDSLHDHFDQPVHTLIELIQGRGENRSPGVVGARTVELIEAMVRSSQQDGALVEIHNGEC